MSTKPWLTASLLLVGWLIVCPPVLGVVVFERGRAEPTIGRLVRQDERAVVIQLTQPDGTRTTREILRSEIEDILTVVSEERLRALRPDVPDAYRDYAEELAAKRKDPDARETSLRLYLIAAYLAPERLGHSCLLGMVALARGPAEERRLRAMAYLLDPNHDRRVLRPAVDGTAPLDDAGRSGLLKAVQAMRRGQRRIALQLADLEPVQKEFEGFEDLISQDEFRSLEDEIPLPLLRRLLIVEWLLTRDDDASDVAFGDRSTPWSRIAERQNLAPVAPLSLETLLEFDPRQCIFDQGRWIRPDGQKG